MRCRPHGAGPMSAALCLVLFCSVLLWDVTRHARHMRHVTLVAFPVPCFAICACPALVIKRDCSYISIHFSLEIAEISLPIALSGKSSGDSK